jgi:hypothetical protein
VQVVVATGTLRQELQVLDGLCGSAGVTKGVLQQLRSTIFGAINATGSPQAISQLCVNAQWLQPSVT